MTLPELLPVSQSNTAAARVERRRAFRLAFALSAEARAYRADPYVNTEPHDTADSGLTAPIDTTTTAPTTI